MSAAKHEKAQAERERLRAQALLAVRAGKGVYNVQPYAWVLGLAAGCLAILFALYAATRPPAQDRAPAPAPPTTGETLIWVE